MLTKLTSLLFLTILWNLSSSECLSADVLTSLGFSQTQTLTKIDNSSVCTELFKTSGSCVPEASVKAKLDADNNFFSISASVFAQVSLVMSTLAETFGKSSEALKKSVNDIIDSTKSSKDSCIEAWSVVQQGVTCYLASGVASSNTSINSTIDVNVKTSEVGPYLSKCIDYIDSICLITAGMSISSDVSVDDSAFLTNKSKYEASCQVLKDNYTCTDDACYQLKYKTIIEVFYKPYDFSFFPTSEIFTTLTNKLSDIASDVTSWFKNLFSRRLLSDSDVRTKSSDDGAAAKSIGENSGYNKVTSGTYAYSILWMTIVLLMIA